MRTREGFKVGAVVVGIVAAFSLAVIGGQTIAANLPQPEPTPTVQPFAPPGFSEGPTKATPTPEPVVEVAPVVEEAPAAPEPSGPILCPPGSVANGSDGYNDTSCYPEICFSISVPNPEHPECDAPFRP